MTPSEIHYQTGFIGMLTFQLLSFLTKKKDYNTPHIMSVLMKGQEVGIINIIKNKYYKSSNINAYNNSKPNK